MPYLSRTDIEMIAERVVLQYKKSYVPDRHMCYRVDISELAEMLGFKIEYVYINKDGRPMSSLLRYFCLWMP